MEEAEQPSLFCSAYHLVSSDPAEINPPLKNPIGASELPFNRQNASLTSFAS